MRELIKIFIILFIGIFLNTLVAQINVYKPFPESFAVWKVSCSCNINQTTPSYYTTQKFQVSGDMVLNSVTYKKVNCAAPVYGDPNQPSGPISTCFGYRNDSLNKKVYYLDLSAAPPVEYLWYDFDLVLGDTLKDTYAFTNPTGFPSNARRIVSSIDSVAFCGKYYKRFNFDCDWSDDIRLIEGVGFQDNFKHTNHIYCPFEPVNLYSTFFSTCIPSNMDEFSERKNSIRSYPNPANSEINLVSDITLLNYVIFSNVGGVIMRGNLFAKGYIDISNISNGLYILKVEDEKGNTYYSKFTKE